MDFDTHRVPGTYWLNAENTEEGLLPFENCYEVYSIRLLWIEFPLVLWKPSAKLNGIIFHLLFTGSVF